MATPSQEELYEALVERHGSENQEKFAHACIGIAGLGGLGSHIAVELTRLGVGHLILVDFDVVDISNLNRQHYFIEHLGQPKPEALVEQLKHINPYLAYEPHHTRLTEDNICTIFAPCDIIIEAFDKPDQKAMITETVLANFPEKPLVGGSGLAGIGPANDIVTRHIFKQYYLCGDGASDVGDGLALAAPRVSVCAGHEATAAMRLILGLLP